MSGGSNGESGLRNVAEELLLRDLDAYFEWADETTASLIVSRQHLDLEDALSVLGLQMRLRHWAELNDRLYFTLNRGYAKRQRLAYPGEGWELHRFPFDRDAGDLIPTVLVTRLSPLHDHHAYRHPSGEVISETDRQPEGALFAPPESVAVDGTGSAWAEWAVAYQELDFAWLPLVESIKEVLVAFARNDDDVWFAAHPDQPERERFVCPGELCLAREEGCVEFVEVSRADGALTRTLLLDEFLPREMKGGRCSTDLVYERYEASRLYPTRETNPIS